MTKKFCDICEVEIRGNPLYPDGTIRLEIPIEPKVCRFTGAIIATKREVYETCDGCMADVLQWINYKRRGGND